MAEANHKLFAKVLEKLGELEEKVQSVNESKALDKMIERAKALVKESKDSHVYTLFKSIRSKVGTQLKTAKLNFVKKVNECAERFFGQRLRCLRQKTRPFKPSPKISNLCWRKRD
eukprot:TRINITY_DN24599_c0_g1_i1.p1 TRINITY_DN24599_c0_g1~~TRINITY_DN24599_c0_g1_i1.p1  ORF type:complete len:115 (+),score=23.36 TRINITY_DN24599_c0_g1_i1:186-530(+)